MSALPVDTPPRFVYDRRYVEPEIQLLVPENFAAEHDRELPYTSSMSRYKPTGVRTRAGFYEYELVEERPLP